MRFLWFFLGLSLTLVEPLHPESTILFPEFHKWMNRNNFRYRTFSKACNLLNERSEKVIVETGTTRGVSLESIFAGDGGSSLLFSSWASKHGGIVYSVDICSQAFDNAKPFLSAYSECFFPTCSDSVQFLENFDRNIDLLYLDSFDFDSDNPAPSQEHHLREIIAAYPKLTPDSVVLIDDCGLPHGGKGLLVIEYLKQRGWKVLIDSYQILLVYDYTGLYQF